jgi:hypothetical protein
MWSKWIRNSNLAWLSMHVVKPTADLPYLRHNVGMVASDRLVVCFVFVRCSHALAKRAAATSRGNFLSMKRILSVLLGALAGAVVLPIAIWACATAANYEFPLLVGSIPISAGSFTSSIHGASFLVSGAVLGACNVILWASQRTFWPRFGSAIGSLGASAYSLWWLTQVYLDFGLHQHGGAFLWQLAFCFPLLLWSLALFFFAVLARRKNATR